MQHYYYKIIAWYSEVFTVYRNCTVSVQSNNLSVSQLSQTLRQGSTYFIHSDYAMLFLILLYHVLEYEMPMNRRLFPLLHVQYMHDMTHDTSG